MHFIHTADWQIGMRAVHAGGAAQNVRAARLRAAERVCETATQEGADFLLIAGDTFEDNSVDRQLVIAVAGILGSLTIPVFVLPGNHDPLQPGSVWEHPVWNTAANVKVLKERRPMEIPGGTLLPCPTFARRSPEDPTAWIANETADGIRIVVAHGSVGELMPEEGGFPIAMDTAVRTNADYVALGHWHSTLLLPSNGAARMAYSGTHEATRFGEANSGNVLLVNIAAQGVAPEIRIKKTGELRWERVGIGETITTPGKLAEVTRRLAQMPDQDKTLLEVVLSGLLFERDRDELPRIESACSRFLSARIDKSGLRPAPNDDDWVRHLPTGAVRATAARLQQLASGNSETAEVATQALLELYTFAHEVQL
jgi:DNA repair exonuclease SbcCD nuclease subunit